MTQVNIHEAKTHLSKLIKKVQNGERVIIARGNKPVAEIVLIEPDNPKRKLGSAKGKVRMGFDFNDALNDFEPYQS